MSPEDIVEKVLSEMREQNLFPKIFTHIVRRYLYMVGAAFFDIGRYGVYPNKNRRVIQYDQFGNVVDEYESIMEAQRATKIFHQSIISACKGRRHSAGGFIWRYKNEK